MPNKTYNNFKKLLLTLITINNITSNTLTLYNYLNKTNLKNIYYQNNKSNTYYNMKKKLIRLTESDLHRIVKESVKRIFENENFNYPPGVVGVEYKNGEPFYQINNPYEYVKQ